MSCHGLFGLALEGAIVGVMYLSVHNDEAGKGEGTA